MDELVVEVLAGSEIPLSAYDLIAGLRNLGRHTVATSVYRALDRLCARDVIEKVEMLSAFRIRDVPQAILMICLNCGRAKPLAVVEQHTALYEALANAGFAASNVALEAAGTCLACREQPL